MSLSVLPYALGATGILKSFDDGNRARRQAAGAEAMAAEEAARRQRIQAMVQEMIQGSGAYAETEGMRRAERTKSGFQRDTGQLLESTAGAFRVAGYKPGDTVTGDAVARVGRERSRTWDQTLDAYIQEAKANRMSEAGAMANTAGITGPNQEYYSNLAKQYRDQAGNASSGGFGAFQTILDQANQDWKKRTTNAPAPAPAVVTPIQSKIPVQYNQSYDPYKGFDSLNVTDLFPKRKKTLSVFR